MLDDALKRGFVAVQVGEALANYRFADEPLHERDPDDRQVLEKGDAIHSIAQRAPVQIHPFSIMEYCDGDMQLHDFVYATAESTDPGFRGYLTEFFEGYRQDKDR